MTLSILASFNVGAEPLKCLVEKSGLNSLAIVPLTREAMAYLLQDDKAGSAFQGFFVEF